jgi:hypothetical protein
MNKLFYCVMVLALLTGCSKSKVIQFCEGVSPDGDGVNCGHTFEDGELTALIQTEEPFGVKAITVQVYEVKGGKTEKAESYSVNVSPDKNTAVVNLSFYSAGRYLVRVSSGDTRIGDGEIRIVER